MADMSDAERVGLVEQFWDALNQRDVAAVGAMMREPGPHIDAPKAAP